MAINQISKISIERSNTLSLDRGQSSKETRSAVPVGERYPEDTTM